MLHKKIVLRDHGRVYMNTYVQSRSRQIWDNVGAWQPKKRPAVLILPGGAYQYCSDREAEPVVFPFLAAGFNAFVLYYSVADDSLWPAPLEDVSRAVFMIREHAEDWNIDPNKIAVGGFSAGGNLAGLLGTQWNREGLCERLGIPAGGNQPNAIFLSYALSSMEQKLNTLGDMPLGKLMENPVDELNTWKYVGKHTPPTFIWHTGEDELLSPMQAMLFAQACVQHSVSCEFHLYEFGRHGLSLSTDLTAYGLEHPTNVQTWVELILPWLRQHFSF
jgi:acetyl esterase/lipase